MTLVVHSVPLWWVESDGADNWSFMLQQYNTHIILNYLCHWGGCGSWGRGSLCHWILRSPRETPEQTKNQLPSSEGRQPGFIHQWLSMSPGGASFISESRWVQAGLHSSVSLVSISARTPIGSRPCSSALSSSWAKAEFRGPSWDDIMLSRFRILH